MKKKTLILVVAGYIAGMALMGLYLLFTQA